MKINNLHKTKEINYGGHTKKNDVISSKKVKLGVHIMSWIGWCPNKK